MRNIYYIIIFKIPQTVKGKKMIGLGWLISIEEGLFTDHSNGLTYARSISQKV